MQVGSSCVIPVVVFSFGMLGARLTYQWHQYREQYSGKDNSLYPKSTIGRDWKESNKKQQDCYSRVAGGFVLGAITSAALSRCYLKQSANTQPKVRL